MLSHNAKLCFSYFELPPYLFIYDCFAIRKIQTFQIFFPYVLAKSWFLFMMACLLLLQEKKEKKPEKK
jgi:hypothetical protein